jgi:hypothetical protein
LSSGLDIVRKTLGGQQIAVAQTTDIDRVGGMVNLTTFLLHTSVSGSPRTGRFAAHPKYPRPDGWERL